MAGEHRTDRFSIPGRQQIIRGEAESGTKEKWSNIYNPEEEEVGHAGPKTSGERISGGGEGGIGRLFEDWENADPELQHLVGEFLQEKYHYKLNREHGLAVNDIPEWQVQEDFAKWLNEEGHEERKFYAPAIKLDKVGYNTELYEKMADLERAWGDKGTKVVWEFGNRENPDSDRMTFSSSRFEIKDREGNVLNPGKTVTISVGEFNKALDKSGIRMRVGRRWEGDKKPKFETILKDIRFGSQTFQGKGLLVGEVVRKKESPKVEKKEIPVDKNAFNLKLNEGALDRLTKDVEGPGKEEARANYLAVKGFTEGWVSYQDQIESVGFETENGKIRYVVMNWKPDKDGKVPAPTKVKENVFRVVFGVWHHEGGFKFVGGGGREAFVTPFTPNTAENPVLRRIMSRVSINGVKLDPSKVEFYIGPERKREELSSIVLNVDENRRTDQFNGFKQAWDSGRTSGIEVWVRNGLIDALVLVSNDGTRQGVSTADFWNSTSVELKGDPETPVGLIFTTVGGDKKEITPEISPDKLQKIVGAMKIDGKGLGEVAVSITEGEGAYEIP